MKKIKLGALALIALVTGVSAFSAKTKIKNVNISKFAAFTYYVYYTLLNGTKLVTTNEILCVSNVHWCLTQFNVAYTTDAMGRKLEDPANKVAVISQKN